MLIKCDHLFFVLDSSNCINKNVRTDKNEIHSGEELGAHVCRNVTEMEEVLQVLPIDILILHISYY